MIKFDSCKDIEEYIILKKSLSFFCRITETDEYVIVTKIYNLEKMDQAVKFFQLGLGSKINVVDSSDGNAYTTIVNKPALRSDDYATFTKSVAQVKNI